MKPDEEAKKPDDKINLSNCPLDNIELVRVDEVYNHVRDCDKISYFLVRFALTSQPVTMTKLDPSRRWIHSDTMIKFINKHGESKLAVRTYLKQLRFLRSGRDSKTVEHLPRIFELVFRQSDHDELVEEAKLRQNASGVQRMRRYHQKKGQK